MIDNWLRQAKEKLFAIPARLLNRIFSPLFVTLGAFFVAVIASYLLARGQYRWALLLWISSRVLDGLDGTMARLSGRQSALGGYLDLMCDIVVYTLFPVAATIAYGGEALIALTFLLAIYYINLASWSILSAILEKPNEQRATVANGKGKQQQMTTVAMPRGIIEGFETVVVYAAFCAFPQYILHLLVGIAILTAVNIPIRLVWAIRNRVLL